MRRYSCTTCDNEVHFDNTVCVSCESGLGYDCERDCLLSQPAGSGAWSQDGVEFRECINRQTIGCNWLVDAKDTNGFCRSCRHTQLIPDLNITGNEQNWCKLERSKRLLFYSLLKFGLSVEDTEQGNPLRFEFKADELTQDGFKVPVMTGHENGLITINIAEADDLVRERHREAMGEPYRTLIGHFRHEIGHYYWDRLVAGTDQLATFREIFGDETLDYARALHAHYQNGAPLGWEQNYVSAYATSHPWEDFAETFAHYVHMIDGLETAANYGIDLRPFCQDGTRARALNDPYEEADLDRLMRAWVPLTVALNAVNRSIGNRDFYPFVLSQTIECKLAFIHALVHPALRAHSDAPMQTAVGF